MKKFLFILFISPLLYAQEQTAKTTYYEEAYCNEFTCENPWPENLIINANHFNHIFEDGYLASIWGMDNAPRPDLTKAKGKITRKVVQSKYFKLGKLSYLSGIINKNGKPIKAPIAVFLPGMFTNLDDAQAEDFMFKLLDQSYHTIVFPNPWSVDFIEHIPLHRPGDLMTEVEVLKDAIEKAHRELIEANLSDGHLRLLGVSYGAFVSAILAGKDDPNHPIITGDVTLMSPPLQLSYSMKFIDNMMDNFQNFSLWEKAKGLVKMKAKVGWNDEIKLSEKDVQVTKGAIAAYGFHDWMVEAILKYHDLSGLDLIKEKRSQWKKNFRFSKYVEDFQVPGIEYMDKPEDFLDYWVKQAQTNEKIIRLFISKDDFINDNSIWDNEWKTPPNYVLPIEEGGHFGIRAMDWFEEDFLDVLFPNENP